MSLSICKMHRFRVISPALVAQLNARLTGDQEVAGTILAGSAAFFHRD